MKIKLLTCTLLISTSIWADETKPELPDISHLVTKVCINGTQYYYREEDRSGTLTPVVENGKFLECTKIKQECKNSWFDGSLVCK